MSLPAGFLDELRARVTLSQVVGRKVTWDMRRSNMAKGDWWAPCPFHHEKSASFHVDDRKGFYYCFGCQAKGDALTFIKDSGNLHFMEAVEELARLAGMSMPALRPQTQERQDSRAQLVAITEAAVQWFRLQLATTAAAPARDYLVRRGLTDAACARWEIGFAPDQRQALLTALRQKGFSDQHILDSGVAAKADDGALYDRFRGRIIFPIRDARGQTISFGGRAMAANARAKYLNGPESVLFDKGRNLFNIGPARSAVGKGALLIVAEGYMDVIALSEAGFGGALAPLGTAVTEDQLRLLWRISDEPIIALDGDSAGVRAALRVADLALPLLEAGKGLRFAMMPQGMDPDDLIRQRGAAAMQAVLDAAKPMVQLLWARETDGKVFDSPERRAALDKTMRGHLRRITDPHLRKHYGDAIAALRMRLFAPHQAPRTAWSRKTAVIQTASAPTRTSLLAMAGHSETVNSVLREAVLLAGCIYHPELIADFDDALALIELSLPEHEQLRDALLHPPEGADLLSYLKMKTPDALGKVLAHPFVVNTRTIQPHAAIDGARACMFEILHRLNSERAYHTEIRDAEREAGEDIDQRLAWRVTRAAELRHHSGAQAQEHNTDVVLAPNGVELNKDEVENAQKILSDINYARKPRKY